MIYTGKAAKISLYINTQKKTATQIKAETGCTAIINGGIYNMSTFKPLCHLKADGKYYASDQYKYYGFAWDVNELRLVTDYEAYKNYICCVCMVRDGKAVTMYYNADMGGKRPRTAIGVYGDGRVWLYASSDKATPEELQQIALKAGVKHAIMLDGGGSTQCIFPDGKVSSTRRVHNFICVWEDEQKTEGADETMFKIALGAGHSINTAGKRCLKSLDPKETREWWLNDRICDYVESYLKEYEGYALLRLDDSDDGKTDVSLDARVSAANRWNANFYLSVHHNAGANGTSAGGIVAYTHPNSSAVADVWRNDLYDALIKHTGLKGNRSNPKAEGDYYVLRHTRMPAVLLELGFMDSKTDVPVILTDEYAQQCARAIVEVIVKRGGLTKKESEPETDALYKVQLGAFANKGNAEKLASDLKAKGYQTYIVKV